MFKLISKNFRCLLLNQLLTFQSFSTIFSLFAQFHFSSNQRSFLWFLWLNLSFDFVCWWSDFCLFETFSIHHRSAFRTTSHRIDSMLWKPKMLSSLRLFIINGINYMISPSLCPCSFPDYVTGNGVISISFPTEMK